MSAVDALVGVHFVDEHEPRTPIGAEANAEESRETCGRYSLIEHLCRREENIRRLGEHSLTREADLVSLDLLPTARVGAQKALDLTLNITLQPCHAPGTSRAPHKGA